ncbi:Serine threonine- kinase svkA [Chlorella sorokiniana]|uniref:non-specific serine/threonine protein kinase n=1 Tax=Chlorella sorokiniana TaxID=3076 RepID=A0A2P6TIM2_CHLSO|nr:Serine threonine- kinase svkA [Chlorella sorokiniana]|eukprot:PRW39080.1 Serine threonine- kinase svkA [Chlorella sorokiniana]
MAAEPAGVPADRYELRELVGRGSFGAVHRGYDRVAQRDVAIKLIDLEDIEEDIGEIQREIAALKECQSPAITQYYGSAVVPGTSQLMIVMELMAASAGDVVGEDTGGEPLPEPCIAYILRQVLHALVYLHGQGRIHRDIKAANILLAEDGRVKVSDFGVSAQLSGTVGYKRRTFVGSPLWMAPEVIEQSPDNIGFRKDGSGAAADGYDEAADIWSLGITAMELAQGEPPRVNVASFRLLFMIVRDDPPQLEGSEFSTDFKDFVWQCLRKDPADRPTAADLLEHPFVAAAETAPPDLAQRVAAYLQRRPALLEKAAQRASLAGYGTVGATLPRWDFAGPAAGTPGGLGAAAGTVVARPVTAPSPGDSSGMLRTGAGVVGEDFGTMVRRHTDGMPSPTSAAAAAEAADFGGTMQVRSGSGLGGVAPPSRLVIPSDPTQPDWPAPAASASYAAQPGTAGPPAGAAAAANGSASKQLLQTGLSACAAAPGATPAVAAAAETAVAALGQLEAARPGAVAEALTEMLTQLSLTSSPALAPLKGSAAALFGGSEAAAAAGGQAAAGGGPELGPLGRFLMQRWREATARERVAHAQQWQAS